MVHSVQTHVGHLDYTSTHARISGFQQYVVHVHPVFEGQWCNNVISLLIRILIVNIFK
jgi:hypothetical protein